MKPYETHGAFSWSELMTSDPKAAGSFYSQLFGWKVEASDMGGGPYHLIKIGDTSIGGIMGKPPGAPADMPPMWGCYVTVSNLDETVAGLFHGLSRSTAAPPTRAGRLRRWRLAGPSCASGDP